MSDGKRQAYVVIAANVEVLPAVLPGWLIEIVDGMARARDALFETEQAVSVVMGGDGPGQEKADRCARILDGFVGEHGHRVNEHARRFAARRGDLPAGMVRSFGTDLAMVASCAMNVAFRSKTLREIGVKVLVTGTGEFPDVLLQLLAEHCPGQATALDWMRVCLLGDHVEDVAGDAPSA